jgi:hypothetical protein
VNDDLIEEIKQRIHDHHKLYRLTIKGEYWEDIFSQAILSTNGKSDWTPDRTHMIGKDQICSWESYENVRISNKSGLYTISSGTLKISGSRSTTYETLEEKIQHFSNKQEDFYSCLATSSLKKDKNYYLFFFDSKLLDYDKVEWNPTYDKTDKQTGWKAVTDRYTAWIKKNLSDQLWTHINIDKSEIRPIKIEYD